MGLAIVTSPLPLTHPHSRWTASWLAFSKGVSNMVARWLLQTLSSFAPPLCRTMLVQNRYFGSRFFSCQEAGCLFQEVQRGEKEEEEKEEERQESWPDYSLGSSRRTRAARSAAGQGSVTSTHTIQHITQVLSHVAAYIAIVTCTTQGYYHTQHITWEKQYLRHILCRSSAVLACYCALPIFTV